MRWIVSAAADAGPPRVLRRCAGCRAPRHFVCSHRFRVNANGRRIDAWLIYRCERCDRTLNVPVIERRPVGSIDPDQLARLEANCAEAARRFARDRQLLAGLGDPVPPPWSVARIADGREPITVELADPLQLRVDRLLSAELNLSRRRLAALWASGQLVLSPSPKRGLRDRVASGLEVRL